MNSRVKLRGLSFNHPRPPECVSDIDPNKAYDNRTPAERDQLTDTFIKPLCVVRNMGASGAKELALKIGALLVSHDPDNRVFDDLKAKRIKRDY